MATIQIESSISVEQLIKAVSQLPDEEIDRFAAQIIALRARRVAPSLSADEAQLMRRINATLPPDELTHYRALVAKREDETLTAEEHAELLHLSDRYEIHDADRLAALSELAQLRRIPLAELLPSLGITSSSDA